MSESKPLPLHVLALALCALLPVAAMAQTAATPAQASQTDLLQAESVNDPAAGVILMEFRNHRAPPDRKGRLG